MARSSAGLAIEEARSRRALSLHRADEAVKAYGLARIMAGGLPNYLELSYGQTTLRHEEQYKHYTGWCFPAGSAVITSEGVLAIEDVCDGMQVLTHNGRFRSVINTHQRYHSGELYTFRAVGNRAVTCTPEHPFQVRRSGELSWIEAKDIIVGDILTVPTIQESIDKEFYQVEIENPTCSPNDPRRSYGRSVEIDIALMELIGLYLAEGHVRYYRKNSGNKSPATVAFSYGDEEESLHIFTIEQMARLFNAGSPVVAKTAGCTTLVFSSRVAAEFFSQFRPGASRKFIPRWILELPTEKLMAMVRGYWIGDGCVHGRKLSSSSASIDLTFGIRLALLKGGVYAAMCPISGAREIEIGGKVYQRKDQHALVVTGHNYEEFCKAVQWGREEDQGNQHTTSGRSITSVLEGCAHTPVRSITREQVENCTVYNLEVEEDNSYTVEGIAVHNCYVAITRIATRIAGQRIKMGRKVEEPSPLSWAWDRPPGRKLPDEDRWRAPTFVKTLDTDIEQIESHPLLEALADPNPIMVPWTLLFHTIASLLITGKTYWWFIEGDDGLQIWPVPSDWVTPVHTDDELFVAYRVRPLGGVGTEGQLVDADEMAYFYLPDPGAPIGAVSPLQSQAPAIAVEEQMQIAQYRSMKNGVNPGVMIMAGRHPSMTGIGEGPRVILSPSQKRELYAAVKQSWQGAANFNTPIIVDGGLIQGVERFTLTPQELDFLQSETMVKARIFQAFGVSPIIAGEIAGVNRAQAAVADALFTGNVVNPLCELIGQTMTKYIGEDDVYFWIETAQADDAEMKLRNWQVLCQYGAVTKNDLRREIGGLPPVEDGDEYVAPAGAGGSAFGGGAFVPPQPPKQEAETKKPPPGTAGEETPATEEEEITEGAGAAAR